MIISDKCLGVVVFLIFLINKDLEETEEKDCFDASMAGVFFLRCILGLFCILF